MRWWQVVAWEHTLHMFETLEYMRIRCCPIRDLVCSHGMMLRHSDTLHTSYILCRIDGSHRVLPGIGSCNRFLCRHTYAGHHNVRRLWKHQGILGHCHPRMFRWHTNAGSQGHQNKPSSPSSCRKIGSYHHVALHCSQRCTAVQFRYTTAT